MSHFVISFSLATTFLLLLSLTATTTAATTTIIDVDNHPVRANTNYYILPVVRGAGGGLTMSPRNQTLTCPLYVTQAVNEVDRGLPLKFLPVEPKNNVISPLYDVNIVFSAATTCVQSTGWRLTLDDATGRRYVATGGEVGNPGVKTVSNWFKFEKVGNGKYEYKIVYCPSVCKFCKVMCGDLGVFVEKDGKRLLGFSDKPLLVMFKKA